MRNSRATGRDMVISLAVLLLPAMLAYWFFTRTPDEPQVPAVDWQPVVAEARQDASYRVLAPTALPETWKPIRAIWKDQQLQLGFLSPDKVYHEVKQQAGANNPSFVRDVTREGRQDGTSTIAGRTWTRTVTDDDRTRCLVNEEEGKQPATRIVCADLPYEGVEAFASTLA